MPLTPPTSIPPWTTRVPLYGGLPKRGVWEKGWQNNLFLTWSRDVAWRRKTEPTRSLLISHKSIPPLPAITTSWVLFNFSDAVCYESDVRDCFEYHEYERFFLGNLNTYTLSSYFFFKTLRLTFHVFLRKRCDMTLIP